MSVLDDLRRLSAAEEFFSYLGVTSDEAVVRVARLHILRRMGDYLRSEPLTGFTDDVVRERCKHHLQTAYDDFIKSSPLKERVFKVLKDAVQPKKQAFVPLAALGRLEKED
jgi:nitrogenase-stabilizing/protective protein